jgi:hypothetical protein
VYCHVVYVIFFPRAFDSFIRSTFVAVILSSGTESPVGYSQPYSKASILVPWRVPSASESRVCACMYVFGLLFVYVGKFVLGWGSYAYALYFGFMCAQGLLPWLGGSVVCPWAHGYAYAAHPCPCFARKHLTTCGSRSPQLPASSSIPLISPSFYLYSTLHRTRTRRLCLATGVGHHSTKTGCRRAPECSVYIFVLSKNHPLGFCGASVCRIKTDAELVITPGRA